jgi:hypothetical protein
VEPYRERIEDFMRRKLRWYEGNRVFRVLAVAILVAGWHLVGSLKTSVLIPWCPGFPPTARWW